MHICYYCNFSLGWGNPPSQKLTWIKLTSQHHVLLQKELLYVRRKFLYLHSVQENVDIYMYICFHYNKIPSLSLIGFVFNQHYEYIHTFNCGKHEKMLYINKKKMLLQTRTSIISSYNLHTTVDKKNTVLTLLLKSQTKECKYCPTLL